MSDSSSSRIKLRKERSVSDVLNVSFRFVRQNAGPLAKNLYLLAGPVAVLVAIAFTGWLIQFSEMTALAESNPGAMNDEAAFDAVVSMFMVFGGVALLGTVMSFLIMAGTVAIVKRYADHGPGPMSISEVWQTLRPKIGTLMLCTLTFYALILFPYVIAIIPCLGALAYLVWALYAMPTFTMVYPMQMFEDIGVIDSFKRARRLVKGEYWSTLGVFFLAMIITAILQGIITIPTLIAGGVASALGFDTSDPGTLFIVMYGGFYVISMLSSVLLYSFVLIAVTFQYFSLVEQKEKAGLRERVEQMEAETESDAASTRSPDAPARASGPSPSSDAHAESEPASPEPPGDAHDDGQDDARRWGRPSSSQAYGDEASGSENSEGKRSEDGPSGNKSAGNGVSREGNSGDGASGDATESSRSSDRSS